MLFPTSANIEETVAAEVELAVAAYEPVGGAGTVAGVVAAAEVVGAEAAASLLLPLIAANATLSAAAMLLP